MDELLQFTQQFTGDQISYCKVGVFAFSDEVQPVLPDASLLYANTRLGEFTGGGFSPSIPLLNWIGKCTERKAVINEKSAWLFICKNNVLKEGIISNPCDSGEVIVVNERDEVLGWGHVQGAGITNKLDLGDYLRRER
jgi:ribosome biogenesis protein Nip4